MSDPELEANEQRLAQAGVVLLTPETTTIFEGSFSLLHCAVKGQDLFRGVFALRMFPVRNPDRFISLHYTDLEEKESEIGVIVDLASFPADQRYLVERSLAKHYQEQTINRVYDIECEYGVLFLEVETQRGRETIIMPWRGDRAEDYGEKGKVLLDSLDNRFIIPDLSALPASDRTRFQSYIYW